MKTGPNQAQTSKKPCFVTCIVGCKEIRRQVVQLGEWCMKQYMPVNAVKGGRCDAPNGPFNSANGQAVLSLRLP
jgi:hypothetical protein